MASFSTNLLMEMSSVISSTLFRCRNRYIVVSAFTASPVVCALSTSIYSPKNGYSLMISQSEKALSGSNSHLVNMSQLHGLAWFYKLQEARGHSSVGCGKQKASDDIVAVSDECISLEKWDRSNVFILDFWTSEDPAPELGHSRGLIRVNWRQKEVREK